jgi:hypothetical protein
MAVKVVPRQHQDSSLPSREIDIGRRVAESGSRLLIPVIDAAETSEALILVMARADRSLRDIPVPMPESGVISVITDVAAGLQDLHSLGIIHRDLKPDNVLLQDGRWKLGDFGIARDQQLGTQNSTFLGWGTDPYKAPEIWERKSPTVKTDLYALGCMAFELLAGVPPFSGERDEARADHLMKPPPYPPTDNIALADLITRLIAKSPGDRPQDARAVLERLHRAQAPRSPAQENIARSFARHTSENEYAAAYAGWMAEAAEARRNHTDQGKAELRDIFRDAYEELRNLDPDATIRTNDPHTGTRNAVCALAAGGAQVRVCLWPDDQIAPPPGDPAIILGWVFITNRRYDYPVKLLDGQVVPEPGSWFVQLPGINSVNLVYEPVGGRLAWQIYRFTNKKWVQMLDKLDRNYARRNGHGPKRDSAALSSIAFQEYRKEIISRPRIRVWTGVAASVTVTITPLNVPTLLELFQEAIDLRPGPVGSAG